MSANYKEYLTKQKKDFKRWVECPSKFEKENTEVPVLKRETKCFRVGGCKGLFEDNTHVAWEDF